MTYDWEDEITDELLDEINAMLPDGMVLAGLAVANRERVEDALIKCSCFTGVAEADIRLDILGDANGQYEEVGPRAVQ